MDVCRWEVESYEPGGQDPVAWLIDPDGTCWLFKPAIVRSDRRQGGLGREDSGGTSNAGQIASRQD
jgi:hypothetical protein